MRCPSGKTQTEILSSRTRFAAAEIEAIALGRSFRSRRMFPVARKNQPKTGIFATSFFPMTTARLG